MSDKKEYRVLEDTFTSFYEARAQAEIQSWMLARPVVVRYKANGKPVHRADVSADAVA